MSSLGGASPIHLPFSACMGLKGDQYRRRTFIGLIRCIYYLHHVRSLTFLLDLPVAHSNPPVDYIPTAEIISSAISPSHPMRVTCDVPLIAPKPISFRQASKFLEFELPDPDEDLSHPPYVRSPQRKRTRAGNDSESELPLDMRTSAKRTRKHSPHFRSRSASTASSLVSEYGSGTPAARSSRAVRAARRDLLRERRM